MLYSYTISVLTQMRLLRSVCDDGIKFLYNIQTKAESFHFVGLNYLYDEGIPLQISKKKNI